jgi:hypothetical protein
VASLKVRKRAGGGEAGNFVQREIERRILDVELRVAGAHLRRLDAEHLPVELDAPLDVADVDGDVGLEYLHV